MTYDCFMFFNELDLLEIRLNILDPYVDKFVICESTQTFSGKSKPLYYKENKEGFAKWNHKIIHHVVGEFDAPNNAFERAYFQKESIMDALKDLKDDDIVYYSDLDEVWTPQEVDDKVYKLKQLTYSYYFNNRSSEEWAGTVVGTYKAIKEMGLNWNRANPENFKDNGGWHFTNCMPYENLIKKLESYDHQEFNNDFIKDNLKDRIINNEDYIGRGFTMWTDETDLPEYVIINKQKYAHLFS